MGLCVSCHAAADEGATTARVVLPGGELREYSPPATAGLVLQQEAAAGEGWFLCDADGMGLEGAVVAAVGAGQELRPGQIYFVLPAEMRRRRLTGEEVAALAVKASSALVKAAAATAPSSPCRRLRRGTVAPLVFPLPEEEYDAAAEPPMSPVAAKTALMEKRRGSPRSGTGRASRFAPDLTAIPESE
jgi:hypothetical protein